MPNLFRKKAARGTRVLKPKAKGPVSRVPGGFTRTKFRAQHELIRSHTKMRFPDREAALKICIQRKLGGLGDVLMTTPSVRAIRQQYPNSLITYATHPTLFRVVENNPDITEIVDFRKIDPGAFDYFADVTSVCPPYERKSNPPINRIDLFAKYIGIQLKDKTPVYVPRVDEVQWAQKWLEQKWGARHTYKLVFISVASVDHRRTWPINKTTQLIDQITALRPDVRIIVDDFNNRGGPWDQRNTTAEKFSFRPAMALLNESDLFIGPDSGFLHGAGALELNVVSIFGPTDPAARINHYAGAIAVEAGLGCQHCWYARCEYQMACMNDLPVAKVQEAVLSKLDFKLPKGALEENRFVLSSPVTDDPRVKAVMNGLSTQLSSLGYKVVKNAIKPGKSDIVIDILSLDSMGQKSHLPPKGVVSCALIISGKTVEKWKSLRLAKSYDVLFALDAETLETVWDSGVRKPAHVVSLPISPTHRVKAGGKGKVDISTWRRGGVDFDSVKQQSFVFDMSKETTGILAAQAIANGSVVVCDEDSKLLIPDSLLVRTSPEILEETEQWLEETTHTDMIVAGRRHLTKTTEEAVNRIISLVYQRLSL